MKTIVLLLARLLGLAACKGVPLGGMNPTFFHSGS